MTKEKLIKKMEQIEYRIIKEDSSTTIGTYNNLNDATSFLKDKINEDHDEFSHRNYCLTMFELTEINGKENWVLNEKFGRMRLTAKTAKGLLDDLI